MSTKELTLKQIQKNVAQTPFESSYTKLFVDSENAFSDKEKALILKTAVVFLNYGDNSLRKFGYRIIVRYSNLFNEYKPLYDVSLNFGYIPVSKFIEHKYLNTERKEESFFNEFFSAHIEAYKVQNYYLSYGQKILANYSKQSLDNFVVVAPTSYGKSEILIDKVLDHKDKKICIIVPSKALLAQTKRRLLSNSGISKHFKRIITHPDMYKGNEKNLVAVLTQERLLRLLQKNPDFSLDFLLLDEAHNLLKYDGRSILLAQVLLIIKKRNFQTRFNFFTPFISEAKNLELTNSSYRLEYKSTSEALKIERFFICELAKEKQVYLYDQFVNNYFQIGNKVYKDECDIVQALKAQKNIIYLNRPKDVEEFALTLLSNKITIGEELEEIFDAISDFLHPDYNLLKCIKSGIVYHHGGMPEIIRLYVENIYSSNHDLEFIVTNSTLLEGVNIPAEKMFLLTTAIGTHNFNKSEFKNLIGRICRFSELFHPQNGHMRMLEPEVYLITGKYSRKGANVKNFLQKTVGAFVKIDDNVENILVKKDLNNEEKREAKAVLEFLENIEPNTVDVSGITYVTSNIGKLCYKNNVYDFDIKQNETRLNRNLQSLAFDKIKTEEDLINAIYEVFINNINITNEELARLGNIPARKFYSMVLSWRTNGSSYKQLIASFMKYWKGLENPIIYAGARWGEIAFGEGYQKTLYVDLRTKTESQKINLAIVRIKEEQDFLDNSLIKYIEILNELEFLDKKFYEKIKYGSSDKRVICLLKNGFSIELAKIITKVIYASYVSIDPDKDEINIKKEIIDVMEQAGENKILVFEISYHIN